VRTLSIPDLVRQIAAGEDPRRLRPGPRVDQRFAIARMLDVLSGALPLPDSGRVDPRDAIDHLTYAVGVFASDDVEHLITLLAEALAAEDHGRASPLAWTLAHMNRPVAADVLMSAAGSRNPFVRWAAGIGLQRLRLRRARPILNRAAADRDSLVRGQAVNALKSLGDASSLPVLNRRLHDRYPGIRIAARRAIAAINNRIAR
jgi:HEAT repeat protein